MSEKKWWSWKREEEEDAGEGSLEWSERSERNGSEPSPATPTAAGGAADSPATDPAAALDGAEPAGVPTPVPVMPDAAAAASDIAETPGQPPEDAQQPGRSPEPPGLAPEDDAATRTGEPRQVSQQSGAGAEEIADTDEPPQDDAFDTDERVADGPDDAPDDGLPPDMGPVDWRPAPLPPNLTTRLDGCHWPPASARAWHRWRL